MVFEGVFSTDLVCLDVCTESNTQSIDSFKHGLAVSSDSCCVQDDSWLGDMMNVLANVELAQFVEWGREPLRESHFCGLYVVAACCS